MKAVKYNPFFPMKANHIDRLIGDLAGRSLGEFMGSEWVSTTPAINIVEQDKSYLIELAAPGLAKEDFDVSIVDDNLVISVSKEQAATMEEGKYTRKEYNYNSFKRSFFLSDDIDRGTIDATYDRGVLTIVMAKTEDVAPPVRTIKIS